MPWKVLCLSTMIGRFDQVAPWSSERITATLKPRLFWRLEFRIRSKKSTSSPSNSALSGSTTIWFPIVC